ncbi:MAG: MFS transporter [Bacillota bacterium]
MNKLLNLTKGFCKDFINHWKVPADGNEVSNQEMMSFAGGGVGVKTVLNVIGTQIQMVATTLLFSSIYGLSPTYILYLFIFSSIIGILKTPFTSWLIDNTNTKMGKFRPYLFWAGIPCIIGVIGVTWLVPVNGTALQQVIVIAIFYSIACVGQQLYETAYIGLSQVITPNTGERSKILTVSEVLANLGPSLVAIILPALATLIWGANALAVSLTPYRVLLPVFALAGWGLGLVVMFNTKERTIVVKQAVNKVKFSEGVKIISKNRNFILLCIARFFNLVRSIIGLLLPWICAYQLQETAYQGLFSTIVSFGFTPGMLIAPLIIKKLGVKKGQALFYGINVITAFAMLLTFQYSLIFFVLFLFLYNFGSGPIYILQTQATAEVYDELQLQSGKRVEGFAQNVLQMCQLIGMVGIQLALTFIYNAYGLMGEDGSTDYDLLYDATIREPIIKWTIIIAIIGGIVSALATLFLNMSKKQHDEIIDKLKTIREESELEDLAQPEAIEPETTDIA